MSTSLVGCCKCSGKAGEEEAGAIGAREEGVRRTGGRKITSEAMASWAANRALTGEAERVFSAITMGLAWGRTRAACAVVAGGRGGVEEVVAAAVG